MGAAGRPTTEDGTPRMRKLSILTAAAAALSLGGCVADYTPPGADIVIAVRTSPPMSSHCIVQDHQGSWNVNDTPEHVDISRARGPLDISCSNNQGWQGRVIVTSTVNPAAFLSVAATSAAAVALTGLEAPGIGAGAVAAIGVGGAITGTGVFLNDAAYDYPRDIVVPMVDVSGQPQPAIPHPAATEPVMVPVYVAPLAPAVHHVYHRPHHVVGRPHCNCGS